MSAPHDDAPHEAHDTPHDHLPSALSSLFDSPHHHFLPAADDVLIDPALEAADGEAAAAAATVLELSDGVKRPLSEDLEPIKRLRRADPSPLDVTLSSLLGENERLRKVISTLERDEDALAEATLRELATAAVGGGFGFESLQTQLEAHAALQMQTFQPVDTGSEVSAGDYIHGLVTQITDAAPPPPPTDPFALTRTALEEEIAAVRAAIARKETEIAAVRDGTAAPEPEIQDVPALESQLAKTTTLLETVTRNVRVLRDIAARLQESHDEIAAEVGERVRELAALEAGNVAADGAAALVQIRGYLEGALKLWRERGQLPPAPIPQLPPLRPDGALPTPPSALPKKRGRPARSTQKPGVVPPALAHLVPDAQTVRARELHAPIRRKGVKRGKSELEREKAREEEEGEMLRSLVGMGVWSREGYDE